MNSTEIVLALRAKYSPPQYALLFEVRNQTGYSRQITRYADAIVMDLYPSKGLYLSGFEFKSSRQDLMNDLKDPLKHKEIAKHCGYWWLVVGDSKIIKEGEVPEGWGLMVPRGQALIIKKHAPFREVETIPTFFIASLLRSALAASPGEAVIRAAVNKAIDHDRKSRASGLEYELESERKVIARLKETIATFKEKTGVSLDEWNVGRAGDAVKFIMDGGLKGLESQMMNIKNTADRISQLAGSVKLED